VLYACPAVFAMQQLHQPLSDARKSRSWNTHFEMHTVVNLVSRQVHSDMQEDFDTFRHRLSCQQYIWVPGLLSTGVTVWCCCVQATVLCTMQSCRACVAARVTWYAKRNFKVGLTGCVHLIYVCATTHILDTMPRSPHKKPPLGTRHASTPTGDVWCAVLTDSLNPA
jgi:hypothetical protein